MNIFSKRYFVWISLVFLLFSRLCFELDKIWCVALLFIFALLLGGLYFILRNNGRFKNIIIVVILLLAAALLGTANTSAYLYKNAKIETEYSGEGHIRGYVSEVVTKNDFLCELVIVIEELDGKKANCSALLVTEYKTDLAVGDIFEADVKIMPISEYENSLYLKNAKTQDYAILCAVGRNGTTHILEREFRITGVLSSLNSKLSSLLKVKLGKGVGELASALLLGNRDLLSDEVLRDFRRAGIYHMLALSGLHVAILVGIIDAVLKKLFLPKPCRVITLAAISLFYVALTGFQLSACRSMLMLWTIYIALAIKESNDTMTALFFAVTLIVLLQPSAIMDIGLLLSFLSTLGVIVATIIRGQLKFFQKNIDGGKVKRRVVQFIRGLLYSLMTSLCVCVATLPVISYYFGEFSLATFFTNMFMGTICELFMIFAIVTLIFSSAGGLCIAVASITGVIGNCMTGIAAFVSGIDNVVVSLKYPYVDYLVWGVFIFSIILLAVTLSRKWLLAIPSVLFAIMFCISAVSYNASRRDTVNVEFMVDDVLVISSSEGVYLCDASNGSYSAFYDGVKLASENCFTEIDGVILTHYHNYHARSLERISNNYIVHSVLLPKPTTNSELLVMRSIIRVLEDEDIPVYIYDTNEELDILSGKLAVSDRAYTAGRVNPSVCVSYEYGDSRFTLVEKPYFGTYLEKSGSFEKYVLDSNVLIFGSDGSLPSEKFEIFGDLKDSSEVYFTELEMMELSDFEKYMSQRKIYFSLEYKKFELR